MPWERLLFAAAAAQRQGMPAHHLALVLSEMHVRHTGQVLSSSSTVLWTVYKTTGINGRQMEEVGVALRLLNFGACPNLGAHVDAAWMTVCMNWESWITRCRTGCETVAAPEDRATATLMEAAGGFPCLYLAEQALDDVPAPWLRFHGRPARRAWLTQVARTRRRPKAPSSTAALGPQPCRE